MREISKLMDETVKQLYIIFINNEKLLYLAGDYEGC